MQACTPTHTPLKTTLKTKSSPQVFPKLAVTLIHCNPEQWTANHISAALFLSSELLVDDGTSDQQKPFKPWMLFCTGTVMLPVRKKVPEL